MITATASHPLLEKVWWPWHNCKTLLCTTLYFWSSPSVRYKLHHMKKTNHYVRPPPPLLFVHSVWEDAVWEVTDNWIFGSWQEGQVANLLVSRMLYYLAPSTPCGINEVFLSRLFLLFVCGSWRDVRCRTVCVPVCVCKPVGAHVGHSPGLSEMSATSCFYIYLPIPPSSPGTELSIFE